MRSEPTPVIVVMGRAPERTTWTDALVEMLAGERLTLRPKRQGHPHHDETQTKHNEKPSLSNNIRVLSEQRPSAIVIEVTGGAPLPALQTVAVACQGTSARLDVAIAVAPNLALAELLAPDQPRPDDFDPTLGQRLVEAIELSTIVGVPEATPEVELLLEQLAPNAAMAKAPGVIASALSAPHPPFNFSAAMAGSGWAKALARGDTGDSHAVVFRARRPMHPGRFRVLADAVWPGVVRIKGFVWLASQMRFVGGFERAGLASTLHAAGIWWADRDRSSWPHEPALVAKIEADWDPLYGDRRQELICLGVGMDREALRADLTACLLTDAEMELGQLGWRYLQNPFPAKLHWHGVASGRFAHPGEDPFMAPLP